MLACQKKTKPDYHQDLRHFGCMFTLMAGNFSCIFSVIGTLIQISDNITHCRGQVLPPSLNSPWAEVATCQKTVEKEMSSNLHVLPNCFIIHVFF